MADTAALVVALSAQLTKFEKDMKGAVDIANTRTKQIETSFTKMNAEINSQLSGLASGFSSRLGAIGGVLSAVGPVGLTIAAGIGAATLAIGFLNEKVDKFVEKQRAMREAAEITGLTLNQLKAVGQAATRTGVDFEKAERGIIKMVVAIDDLRSKGTGPLVDTLNKLDPQLVRQLINADNSAEAFDILAKALSQMEGEFAKAGFASDVFGKRNIELLRVLRDLTQQGGLVKAALDLEAQGKGIDKDFTDRLIALDNEIKLIRKSTDRMFGEAFSLQQRQAEKETAELMNALASATLTASNNMRSFVDAVLAYIATKPGVKSANEELENLKVPQLTVPPRGTSAAGRIPNVAPADIGIEIPVPQRLPPSRPVPTQVEIEAFRQLDEELEREKNLLNQDILFTERWAGVLGDAIKPAEQMQVQQNKINKALQEYAPESEESVRLQEAGNRSLQLLNAQQQIAANNLRERLLLLTEEEIVENKLSQAKLDAQKTGQAGIDLTKAEILFRKQAKEAIEGQAVALSKLPESVRFSQEAMDSFKQLDKLLVTTAGSFENAFADIATSSKTASEAFKALADSIIRDLIRIVIRMSVTGPLLKAFAGATGGGTDFFSNLFSGRQSGGPVRSGQPYVVGEHGPELFVPQSAGKVVPNAISSGKAVGGTMVEINNYVAADTETKQTRQEGPTGDRIIIDIVKKAQARGELDDVNRGRFGLRPAKVR